MSSVAISSSIAVPRPGWMARHWFSLFATVFGTWVWLPLLAPVLMRVGWDVPGRAIYFVYAFFCHQLPERSFFLFGPRLMYSLSEIQAASTSSISPFVLRRFIGSTAMGWKIAWSDRMISFYGSIWLFAVWWYSLRRKDKPLPWWGLLLLLLPIALDGGTHAISDLWGIGKGFRDSNVWLAALTGRAFPPAFYAGDALGSFNSLMRLIT